MSAKSALQSAKLYAILDLGYVEEKNVLPVAEALVNCGAGILQVRAKQLPPSRILELVREILPVCRAAGVLLVVNDHPEVCREAGADGVHVGQDDRTIEEVRSIVGEDALVGKSTHSLAQAAAAAEEPVDYIGFGPLFATPTKPDYHPVGLEDIEQVHRTVSLPMYCIGGIKRENLPTVLSAGAKRAVIVSGLLTAPDIVGYGRDCLRLLDGEKPV